MTIKTFLLVKENQKYFFINLLDFQFCFFNCSHFSMNMCLREETCTVYLWSTFVLFSYPCLVSTSSRSVLVFKCQDTSIMRQLHRPLCKESNFLPHLRWRCRGAGADGLRGHHGRRAHSEGWRCGQRRHQGQGGWMVTGRAGGEERHLPSQFCQGLMRFHSPYCTDIFTITILCAYAQFCFFSGQEVPVYLTGSSKREPRSIRKSKMLIFLSLTDLFSALFSSWKKERKKGGIGEFNTLGVSVFLLKFN